MVYECQLAPFTIEQVMYYLLFVGTIICVYIYILCFLKVILSFKIIISETTQRRIVTCANKI